MKSKAEILVNFDITSEGNYEYTVMSTFTLNGKNILTATEKDFKYLLNKGIEDWREKLNRDIDKLKAKFDL